MSPPSKKFLKKGAHGFGDDPENYEFLKIDRDPFEASASGHGYNAKFSDDDGYERGCGPYTDCDHGLVNKLPDEAQAGIRYIGDLIDRQQDQPAGKWLGGGGPVSDGERDPRDSSWRGSGRKGPKYAPKTGPQGNMRKPR